MTIGPSDIQLTGRVAVVTGGGAGIGRGIAAGLTAFGASVAIWEHDAESCTAAAESVGALGIVTDVRDSAQIGDDPGQQCGRHLLFTAARHQRKRLGRYTKTAAFELAPDGIRVNALAPDVTLTEGLASLGNLSSEIGRAIPMGRPGRVDEIASAAVFLASDMASYITGQTIHIDGGTHAAGGWYHDPQTGEPRLGPG
jgi:3-oxoacyl-[acyl-carrier protein] reductase